MMLKCTLKKKGPFDTTSNLVYFILASSILMEGVV